MPLTKNEHDKQLTEFFLKIQPTEADFMVVIQHMEQDKLNFNACDDSGETILIRAVKCNHVEVVYSILAIVTTMPEAVAKEILEARDNSGAYGKTALVHAVSGESDAFKILAALIVAGADPKARYNPTKSELMHALETAAMNGHLKSLRLLLEHYIRKDISPQKNALRLASTKWHSECAYLIAAHMALYDPWSDANNKLLKALKDHGIDGLKAALDPTVNITTLHDLQNATILLQSVKKSCEFVRNYKIMDIDLSEITTIIENYRREHYPSRKDKAVTGFFAMFGFYKANIVSGEIVAASELTKHRVARLFTA